MLKCQKCGTEPEIWIQRYSKIFDEKELMSDYTRDYDIWSDGYNIDEVHMKCPKCGSTSFLIDKHLFDYLHDSWIDEVAKDIRFRIINEDEYEFKGVTAYVFITGDSKILDIAKELVEHDPEIVALASERETENILLYIPEVNSRGYVIPFRHPLVIFTPLDHTTKDEYQYVIKYLFESKKNKENT